jgi:hypothetical protein
MVRGVGVECVERGVPVQSVTGPDYTAFGCDPAGPIDQSQGAETSADGHNWTVAGGRTVRVWHHDRAGRASHGACHERGVRPLHDVQHAGAGSGLLPAAPRRAAPSSTRPSLRSTELQRHEPAADLRKSRRRNSCAFANVASSRAVAAPAAARCEHERTLRARPCRRGHRGRWAVRPGRRADIGAFPAVRGGDRCRQSAQRACDTLARLSDA